MFRAWLVAFGLLLSAVHTAAAEPRLALVIGNDRYEHGRPLHNAVGDARLIASKLKAVGFTTTLVLNADKFAFEDGVRRFTHDIRGAGPGAVAVVFYAGHGLQHRGRNYLVPVDAPEPDQPRSTQALMSGDDLVDAIVEADAHVGLFFFDACRSDPFPGAEQDRPGLSDRMGAKASPGGVLISYATHPGGVASDGVKGGHGPYAAALAKALTERGLSVEQVLKRVGGLTRQATGGRQEPWVASSLVGDFVFAGGRSLVDAAMEAQRVWWERIRGSLDVAQYELFLRAHPASPYADAAKLELAEARRIARGRALAQGRPGALDVSPVPGGVRLNAIAPGAVGFGKLFAGDVITKVDGVPTRALVDVGEAIRSGLGGSRRVKLDVRRKALDLMVMLP